MLSKQPARGKLIVFEGPDGVGKSTISAAVCRHLESAGEPTALVAFPGNESGTLGRLVYDIHHEPARFGIAAVSEASKQTLHIAAHLDAIERSILPLVYAGRHVILDRYWWSTWVYGVVGGIDHSVLRLLIDAERAQWGDVHPTLTILLRRETPIAREHDLVGWLALQREYDHLADRERPHYPVLDVDNNGPFDGTLARVLDEVLSHLRQRRPTRKLRRANAGDQPPLAFLDEPSSIRESAASPMIMASMGPAHPSAVYDTYWRFAAERQRIFFARLESQPPPWTADPVLSRYKFTNAYRASDRVSQYLIRHVIYRDELPTSATEVIFRIILFKIFNRIETWELLEQQLGEITYESYSFNRYDAILANAMRAKRHIYSAAYIMPPGDRAFGEATKHRNHLRLLEGMMGDELPKQLADTRSMQAGFDLLRSYPTIGDFLAYQFITDVNYSDVTHFSEMEFVVPGPGALDGMRKCFLDSGGLNEPEMIRLMVDRQEQEFARLGLVFRSLWGRPLQLIDCQNLFCEVGKYARVAHPESVGRSGRSRIKQHFTPGASPIRYWYPPKWGINDAVEAAQRQITNAHRVARGASEVD